MGWECREWMPIMIRLRGDTGFRLERVIGTLGAAVGMGGGSPQRKSWDNNIKSDEPHNSRCGIIAVLLHHGIAMPALSLADGRSHADMPGTEIYRKSA
ncbi:hypothetical protein VNO77_29168 [Canavalia gladiata]|uniref:Uncharacterized protein n=1 Tax=Canavalia gladiata TaxID=3824 RepID=A0AAN9KWU5_CANGL